MKHRHNTITAIGILSGMALFGVLDGSRAAETRNPPNWAERKPVSFEALQAGFSNPDMIYAPFAFWFWDEPLNPDKMAEMSRTIASQRMNPGYAHPRNTAPGVAPANPLPQAQWLSPLWFDAFGRAVAEAEKQHAYLGYCDEYMWPSFQAGGRVLQQHPELKSTSLWWDILDDEGGTTVDVPRSFFGVGAQADGLLPKDRTRPEPMIGQWIWQPAAAAGKNSCYFRKTFSLPTDAVVSYASIKMTADDRHVLYANGQRVGSSDLWTNIGHYDVTALLRPGRNAIAIEGGGDGGCDAMTFGMRVELADGKVASLQSDPTWRVATAAVDGWIDPGFNDAAWQPVRVVAEDPGAAPWNLMSKSSRPHVPVKIKSETLTVLAAFTPTKNPPSAAPQEESRMGQWIWRSEPASGPHTCYMRKTFDLPKADIQNAVLKLTVDDRYTLFVNGQQVGQGESWMDIRTWDVKALLHPGRNVIAVEGGGADAVNAMTMGLRVELAGDKVVTVQSDSSWRYANEPEEGWIAPTFNDSKWKPVCVVAPNANASPWNLDDKAIIVDRAQLSQTRMGQWIWRSEPSTGSHTCYMRKTFELPSADVRSATLKLTVDDRYVLFVNGQKVGQCEPWNDVRTWDVKSMLRPGRNVIAVEGGGDGPVNALILGLRVELAGDKVVSVQSDSSWRYANQPEEGWMGPAFNDSAWSPVRVVAADAGALPWKLDAKTVVVNGAQDGAKPRNTPPVGEHEAFVWQAPAGSQWRIYVFHKEDQTGVNYLDERLPAAFMPIAHEPYMAQMGKRMGTSIPGVFVDNEGHYGEGLAWSDTLDRTYRERWGRDIRQWMPLMVDDDAEGRYAQARWDWFEVVSDLYAQTMGSTSRWLEQRGLYCIENLWEESLQWQARYVGDFFKLSRAYSMPGNDCLQSKCLQVHDFKEVQSVSEFEDRRFMSEIMGAGSWKTFTPTLMKQAVNSVTAWGVGHIVPHGIFTRRKLDGNIWTPDWYNETPWFPSLHLWTDFARRASYINSHGHLVPDVLLLNPMDTVWAQAPYQAFDLSGQRGLFETEKCWGEKIKNINQVYSDAIDQLTAHRVEFLVADRHYIGQMELTGAELTRGEFRFKTVILPPMDVLPTAVAQKIADFAKAGGIVYALGWLPIGSTEHGMNDEAMRKIMDELQAQSGFHRFGQGLAAALANGTPGLESQIRFLAGGFPMLQHHLRIDGRDFYWLANNAEEARECEIEVMGAKGATSLWDCENGNVRPIPSEASTNGSRLKLSFKPLEAFWLVIDPNAQSAAGPTAAPQTQLLLVLEGPWNIRVAPDGQPALEHPAEWPAELGGAGVERPLQPWIA
ncbi:MAG: hypothetical protein K9M54_08230, partial [Kiritimatiellales bacterium]|nr:hypothetical protein [Kiritimatiellales bacterium]